MLIRANNVVAALQSYANTMTGLKGRDAQVADLVPAFQTVNDLGHTVLVKPHPEAGVDYSKCDTALECAQELWDRQIDSFHDDLIRRARCVFLDAEPSGELDAGYGGQYCYGVVEYSYGPTDLRHGAAAIQGDWYEHEEPVMIFWRYGTEPPTPEELRELLGDDRLLRVSPEELGEDAFGLCLL